jgi:hypothetical protein
MVDWAICQMGIREEGFDKFLLVVLAFQSFPFDQVAKVKVFLMPTRHLMNSDSKSTVNPRKLEHLRKWVFSFAVFVVIIVRFSGLEDRRVPNGWSRMKTKEEDFV